MNERIRVLAVLFPGVTQLDLTGPVQVFAALPGVSVELAWHRLEPVPVDCGFSILPTTTFVEAGRADVLLVPGGAGALELMADEAALEFVRAQSEGARFVTSVCTGAFVLGAAGLLAGRRATTHWASLEMLRLLGARPVRARVVRDGPLVTSGGVTGGIDFALQLAAELLGEEEARRAQLRLEYDPRPPFDAGGPDRPQTDRAHAEAFRDRVRRERLPLVRRAAERLAQRPRPPAGPGPTRPGPIRT